MHGFCSCFPGRTNTPSALKCSSVIWPKVPFEDISLLCAVVRKRRHIFLMRGFTRRVKRLDRSLPTDLFFGGYDQIASARTTKSVSMYSVTSASLPSRTR